MPFFFSDAELAAGWVRNGRPEEDVPGAPLMMDLRTLVGAMQQDAGVRAKAALGKLTSDNADIRAGINIVLRAIESPIRQIVENAGVEGSIVVSKVLENKNRQI